MEYHIFKGGLTNGGITDLRLVPNQRPADGHIKSGTWENFERFKISDIEEQLEVGDKILIFTTVTFGYTIGLGARVVLADEGFKSKLVSYNEEDLAVIKVKKGLWDEAEENFTDAEDLDWAAIEDLGSEQAYFSGATEKNTDFYSQRTDAIVLEVLEVPSETTNPDVIIEFRTQYFQPVRPPAEICC